MRNRFLLFCLLFICSSFAVGTTSIRDIDFNNFDYPWSSELQHGVPSTWRWTSESFLRQTLTQTLRMKNGTHAFSEERDEEGNCPHCEYASVDHIVFVDIDRDGNEE